MSAGGFLRQKAEECRELQARATVPVVIAQLGLWAREFEEEAARAMATTVDARSSREEIVAKTGTAFSTMESNRDGRNERKRTPIRAQARKVFANVTSPEVGTTAPRYLWLRLTPRPRLTAHRDD